MVAWSSAWLIVLAAPAEQIVRGQARPGAVAVALLASFVGLYLTLLWVASDPNRSLKTTVAMLAPLTAIALTGSLAFHESWVFLFFFLSAAAACALPERLAVFGIVGVTVIDAVVVTRSSPTGFTSGPQIFGVFMAGLIVMFILRMMRLVSDLNAARDDLARLAVADERLRFARDLHDLLGHTLSLIVVKSEAVRRLVGHDVEAAVRESGDIEMVSRQALAEVREAVTNYRDRSLDAELEGARMTLAAAGIEATINRPAERLPDTVESVLGWTVREGVTNVVRHSHGRHCDIDLRHADGLAHLEIRDDGVGEAPAVAAAAAAAAREQVAVAGDRAVTGVGGGLGVAGSGRSGPAGAGGLAATAATAAGGRGGGTGLRGLAERLAAANGWLEAGRQPGGGFRLAVTVPLAPDGRGSG
ncbi:MAG: two-component system, NarL family, sensor histidine kinase DesK [Acidimicrobiaceae bacterium]|nr:two-component system, NarL family, sensor histidine kinase DesK [Acidimicrobiaceae bacterium]